jgi:hypothetical protein
MGCVDLNLVLDLNLRWSYFGQLELLSPYLIDAAPSAGAAHRERKENSRWHIHAGVVVGESSPSQSV